MPIANITQPGSVGKANIPSAITKDNTWIIDTGASDHMIRDSSKLQHLHPSSQQVISTANGGTSPITGEGSLVLSNAMTLDTVLVVPSLEYNSLSVSQITSKINCTVTFWPSFCVFQDILTRRTLGCGVKRGKLYYLELTVTRKRKYNKACLVTKGDRTLADVWLWHRRLGHLSFGYLKKLKPSLFTGLNVLDLQCDVCELIKSHSKPYLSTFNKCSSPFMVIHTDIWGLATIPFISKARYFITFIDEYTRMTWITLLRKKSDASTTFQEFYNMVKNQFQ